MIDTLTLKEFTKQAQFAIDKHLETPEFDVRLFRMSFINAGFETHRVRPVEAGITTPNVSLSYDSPSRVRITFNYPVDLNQPRGDWYNRAMEFCEAFVKPLTLGILIDDMRELSRTSGIINSEILRIIGK